jgi:hypothetical protein
MMLQSAILWVKGVFEKNKSCAVTQCAYIDRFEAIEQRIVSVAEQIGEVRAQIQKLTNREL